MPLSTKSFDNSPGSGEPGEPGIPALAPPGDVPEHRLVPPTRKKGDPGEPGIPARKPDAVTKLDKGGSTEKPDEPGEPGIPAVPVDKDSKSK